MSTATCWVPGATGSPHDVDNLPYGVFTRAVGAPRVGVRVADSVLDLAALAAAQGRDDVTLFATGSLNPLMGQGRPVWAAVRRWVTGLLTDPAATHAVRPHLVPLRDIVLRLPFEVADYVDFYASWHHATNVGRILRPDGAALAPNWTHLPVGYHGRSSSVVVSGTDVRRPRGQLKDPGLDAPTYGPTRRLDVEAELGFVVGSPSTHGEPVPTERFADVVFGVVGLNDWSARDVQAWEYVPLGPHLSKSFATSVSAWVTPLEALEAARVELPGQDPPVLPYLRVAGPAGYDVDVEVEVNGEVVSTPPFATTYWGPAQMLAHLTANGAPVRTGDLYASGTISGPTRRQRGSFLELSWGGTQPWTAAGQPRTFLEDGDEVVLRYTAPGARGRLALGEVRGAVRPAG